MIIVATVLLRGAGAAAYTPEDPVVLKMVDRGIAFIEQDGGRIGAGAGGFMGQLGTQILKGYTHLKVRYDPEAPVVKRGLDATLVLITELKKLDVLPRRHTKATYEIALACMFLADLDKERFKSELKYLNSVLLREQYPTGGFGYAHERQGDISQTQYAVLAFWTLDHVGIPLTYERVEAVAQYLLRVQDPTGGWPYKGNDPGPNRPLTQQSGVTPSMALAGGSSILIAADALRLWGEQGKGDVSQFDGMPKAVKLYVPDENQQRRKVTMSKEPIFNAVKGLDQYGSRVDLGARPGGKDYFYYQLYTQERYESFLEIAKGGNADQSPSWYNRGVESLQALQGENGSFRGKSDPTYLEPVVDTCFGILFLIRSTKKSIAATSSGSLAGGFGLPKDTTKIRVDGTQIKGEPVATSVTDLLEVLGEDDGGLEGKTLPENMVLATDPDQRRAQIDRLERLLRGSKSWQARRVAARVLGQSDEIRVVPTLIFALSDPDTEVLLFARDGLRFISRKFEGFGMPAKPNYSELRKAQNQWRQWYLTMDPGHIFLEQ